MRPQSGFRGCLHKGIPLRILRVSGRIAHRTAGLVRSAGRGGADMGKVGVRARSHEAWLKRCASHLLHIAGNPNTESTSREGWGVLENVSEGSWSWGGFEHRCLRFVWKIISVRRLCCFMLLNSARCTGNSQRSGSLEAKELKCTHASSPLLTGTCHGVGCPWVQSTCFKQRTCRLHRLAAPLPFWRTQMTMLTGGGHAVS